MKTTSELRTNIFNSTPGSPYKVVFRDPNDEPASVVLERIQEERRNAEAAGGKRRGRGQPGEQLSFAPETADGS